MVSGPTSGGIFVEGWILQHEGEVERLFDVLSRYTGEEVHGSLACLVGEVLQFRRRIGGLSYHFDRGECGVQRFVGTFHVLGVWSLSQVAGLFNDAFEFLPRDVDGTVLEGSGLVSGENQPALGGCLRGDVKGGGSGLAIGVGQQHRWVGCLLWIDEVIAAMPTHIHTSTHQVDVVRCCWLGMTDGTETAVVGHVVARSGILDLIVLVVRGEAEIPGSVVVGCCLFGCHRLPLQLVGTGLDEV